MLKIVFIGPQGSGKSVLAAHLANRLEFPLISEVARDVATRLNIPSDSPNIPLDVRYVWQISIMFYQLQRELEDGGTYGGYVSDRSVIDNFTYLSLLATMKDSPVPKDYWDFWMERLKPAVDGYTHIFYPEPLSFIKEDGFRNADKEYQNTVARRMEGIIWALGIEDRVIRVPVLPIEERVKWVEDRITL